MKKFGIKEVVATGIGTALFIVLTEVQIPLGIIPNTSMQPRAAVMAFLPQCLDQLLEESLVFWDMRSEMHCFMAVYGGAGYSRMQFLGF